MANLFLYGNGGHAKVVSGALGDTYSSWNGPTFTDSPQEKKSITNYFPPEEWQVFLGIGDNRARRERYLFCKRLGYKILLSVKADYSWVSPQAEIGEGTFIAQGVVVQPGAKIGVGVIINTGATVDHDCLIGDFVHIAPGVHLCGNVTVGEGTLVGVGSSVIPKTSIGRWSVVAGGSAVASNIPDRVLAAGNPATIKRQLG